MEDVVGAAGLSCPSVALKCRNREAPKSRRGLRAKRAHKGDPQEPERSFRLHPKIRDGHPVTKAMAPSGRLARTESESRAYGGTAEQRNTSDAGWTTGSRSFS